MKEFKGTPAPWYIDGEHIVADSGNEQQNETICDMYPTTEYNLVYERSPTESRNNGALISAAPELLEALQNLVKWEAGTVNHVRAYKDAEAAINKALTINN